MVKPPRGGLTILPFGALRKGSESVNSISWKPVIIAAVFLTAIVYVLPTFIPGFPLQKKINLGLDLQGGMHLVLEVETDKAVAGTIERTAQELKERSRRAEVRRASIEKIDDASV